MWHAQGQHHPNINCIFYNLSRLQKWNICTYKHAIMKQDFCIKCNITSLKLLNVQYIRTVSESNIVSGEGNEINSILSEIYGNSEVYLPFCLYMPGYLLNSTLNKHIIGQNTGVVRT